MKILNIISLGLVLTAMASCEKPLETNLDNADVVVELNESVIADGNIIRVPKNTPIKFNIIGEPDYITFYSGERGHNYAYKDRVFIDMEQIKSSTLSFGVNVEYGNPAGLFKLLYSTDFTGLYKDNFKSDSLLLEESTWGELVPNAEFPQTYPNDGTKFFDVDMKPYFGKNITLAVRYEGIDETQTQSKVTFSNMKITNIMANGSEVIVDASSFGFTPINMNYKDATEKQIGALPATLKMQAQENLDVLQYATVTNGAAGFWRTDQIATGKFWMNSAKYPDMPMIYSWLVSDYLSVNACEPDTGISVKNMSTAVKDFEYTYDKVGTYTATFSLHNANYKYSEEKVRNIVICVE